jgi:hypothetical protein
MAFPDIVIGSSFDGKGFKQAMSSTDKLSRNIKNLAAGFGVAFGTAAVIGFAKKSVKASLEAQAQQERLASLLQVTVGATDAQIASLDAQAAALEKVGVVSAGNITQTQSQLATFNLQLSTIEKLTPAILDYVTAEKGATATTEQFKSMTNGLAQALNGNFAALTRTGFVLDENTKSIIENGTESERVEAIVAVLNSTYKDFNKNLRDTPAGQMAVLANAAQEATTVIGTSLLGALQSITKSQDIEQLAEKVIDFGNSAGAAIEKLGTLIRDNLGLLKTLGVTFAAIWTANAVATGISTVLNLVNLLNKAYKALRATAIGAAIAQAAVLNPLGAIAWGAALVATITAATISVNKLGELVGSPDPLTNPGGGGFTDSQNTARLAAEKKARLEALARSKALLTAEKKRLAAEIAASKAKEKAAKKAQQLEKARAALSKAAAQFDLTKIQIAAALKNTYDKDERLRLLALQEIENDNGEAALKYIDQLNLLTKEQQTNKLAGIATISQSELNSINKLLLDELARISSTKMSQEQADAARAEAYRKYNAAIIASGGLAEANFYTEKTQTDLLKIARLAALHDVATAQATLDLLNYKTQTDIIDRIAAAQKLADDAKMASLRAYLALLGSPVVMPTPIVPPTVMPPGFGGGGQPIPPGYGGMFDYSDYLPANPVGSSNNSITVVVEGSVLDGNDFVDIVNNALLNSQRQGRSQFAAGTIVTP